MLKTLVRGRRPAPAAEGSVATELAAAAMSCIGTLPVIVAVMVSVAVMVCLPAVLSVAPKVNVCLPASVPVKV